MNITKESADPSPTVTSILGSLLKLSFNIRELGALFHETRLLLIESMFGICPRLLIITVFVTRTILGHRNLVPDSVNPCIGQDYYIGITLVPNRNFRVLRC